MKFYVKQYLKSLKNNNNKKFIESDANNAWSGYVGSSTEGSTGMELR